MMWPYPSYSRQSSWDRYYSQSLSGDQRHVGPLTSGIAAALTVGLFFAAFLITLGCRLLSSRWHERRAALGANRSANGHGFVAAARFVSDDQQRRMFVCCSSVPLPPLPNYEDALKMPSLISPCCDEQPPPSFHAPFLHPPPKTKECADGTNNGGSNLDSNSESGIGSESSTTPISLAIHPQLPSASVNHSPQFVSSSQFPAMVEETNIPSEVPIPIGCANINR